MPSLTVLPAEASKADNVHISSSLDGALELLSRPEFDSRVESVFVIGGGQASAVAVAWGFG
jgi:hypothetical protein